MFVVVLELNDLSFFKQTIIALYLNPCSSTIIFGKKFDNFYERCQRRRRI